MNDDDELNQGAVLSAVRDSISGLPLPAAPRLEAITARGRARRRRHLGGLSVVAAGACAALAVGLAGGGGPAAGPGGRSGEAASHDGAPSVQLAAFSVAAGPDGSTTLTLYPGQVANPNAVRQALAEHGIPAVVTAGEFCRTADQPAPGVGEVAVFSGQQNLQPGQHPAGQGPGPVVIYGSKIPAGVKLSIGYRQSSQEREISFTLIKVGEPLMCKSLPDTGPSQQ
jgi:hypothetical protein